ncbi:MAG TPA: zinc-dependent metalloprotease [Puia sp.]|nr:zinc-dependent metalloprotease [Puia sp.]
MLTKRPWIYPCALAIALSLANNANAQHKRQRADILSVRPADTTQRHSDSSKRGVPPVRPYKDVITPDMQTYKGFFTVHRKEDKYYFEIPNALLGRDILVVNRVAKASADMRNGAFGYAGDEIGESVYRFEAGPSKKLFLRRISFSEYANDSTRSMFAAVQKNNVQAIAQAFPIAAFRPDSTAIVVDATELLNSDNDILYFERKIFKDRAGMGAQQNDRSYIEYVHTYASNVDIRAVKTYSAGLNPTSSNYTVELNSSLVLLPEKPMTPRMQDKRIGYFTTQYKDFDADPQGVKQTVYVKRWRLEPRPEDMEKYKRGELVEPLKPIVFYIDPVTPKKWVPYLVQGVNDWQKAFEQAGFKNAIVARIAPTKEEDSTWSIDDASHSAIIYRPSVIANAMGPSVADPRSGEIIESHIFWYHNVMSLLHDWYLVQCGAVDPRARKPQLDDELMGNLIRFVSSHEVGHALGLLHNFGSSSTVPVEKLRDKAWVEAHGHTPSIMDYARFNYVAQPEDNISEAGLFPRIGDYDKWAIQWAYTLHPEYKTAEEECKALVGIVTDSLKKDHRLWFGDNPYDARCQTEDLGDNAVKAGGYGIRNLKRIFPELINWTSVPGEGYESLFRYTRVLFGQYELYLGHAMSNIGTIYHTERIAPDEAPVFEMAPYAVHKEAVRFVNEQLFTTPLWLNNEEVMNKLPVSFGVELNNLQSGAINMILTRDRMSRLLWAEQSSTGRSAAATKKTYTVTELLDDLNKGIFRELYEGKNVDAYRRNLQKIYVGRLIEQAFTPSDQNLILPPSTYHIAQTDLLALLKDALRQQQKLFKKAMVSPTLDKMTRLHLQDLDTRISGKFAEEQHKGD